MMKFIVLILLALFHVSMSERRGVVKTKKSLAGIPEYPSWATAGITVSRITFPAQGQKCKVDRIRVDVNLVHTWTHDLIMFLCDPDIREVQLISHQGGNCDDMHAIFTDASANPAQLAACDHTPPGIEGDFAPDQPLSTFRGYDMSQRSTWMLYIRDALWWDRGQLLSWTLDIEMICDASILEQTVMMLPILISSESSKIIKALDHDHYPCPSYGNANGNPMLGQNAEQNEEISHDADYIVSTHSKNTVFQNNGWMVAAIISIVFNGIFVASVLIFCVIFKRKRKGGHGGHGVQMVSKRDDEMDEMEMDDFEDPQQTGQVQTMS